VKTQGRQRPPLLEIENLTLELGGKVIIRQVNLQVREGEVMVMFGPNGVGKSSLLLAIMGFPRYRVSSGRILFRGRNLAGLSIDERARLGIGMMFQHPPAVRGVKLGQMASRIGPRDEAGGLGEELNLSSFLDRDLNLGFSGGEMKRAEVLQLRAQSPELLLLDEPESGVDMENMALLGDAFNRILHPGGKPRSLRGALVITHTGYILDYLPADRGCVLLDHQLKCTNNPRAIFQRIRKVGFQDCQTCSEQ